MLSLRSLIWFELCKSTLLYVGVAVVLQLMLPSKLRRRLWDRLSSIKSFGGDDGFVFRTIETRVVYSAWEVRTTDLERRNRVLQKAIMEHIARLIDTSKCDIAYELVGRSLDEVKALNLPCTGAKKQEKSSDDYDEPVDKKLVDKPQLDELRQLCVGAMPLLGEWVPLAPGLYFRREELNEEEEDDDFFSVTRRKKVMEVTTRFTFKSNRPDGAKAIEAFVQEAFRTYKDTELAKASDNKSRFMYLPAPPPNHDVPHTDGSKEEDMDEDDDCANEATYTRFPLSDEKTFDNLFFPGKNALLELLDDFQTRQGRFAAKGSPHKVSLLLHGPPGTGKTSLIKAIAQHTQRHVVSISLSRMETNEELMDAMMDLRYKVQGVELPVHLRFKDIVFVLEDVDCASAIVHTGGTTGSISGSTVGDQSFVGCDDNEGDKWEDEGEVDDEDEAEDEHESLVGDENNADIEDEDDDRSEVDDGDDDDSLLPATENPDKLRLETLLDVLDGNVDCPGRILIMTTNHPEHLHPALVRPGRVTKQLCMSYMGADAIHAMLQYYFDVSELPSGSAEQLQKLDGLFTPAEIEEMCAEFDDVDTLLRELKKTDRRK